MPDIAVRCPGCGQLSRVPADALFQTVACPACDRAFVARPDAVPPRDQPRFDADREPAGEPPPDRTLLLGLALLPLGIPLVWLLGPTVANHVPLFSPALPAAVAVGVCGLCLGVVFAADWSRGTRVRGILMLAVLGYGAAGFLFFLKKDWVEAVRRGLGRAPEQWRPYTPDDGSYRVKFPGPPDPDPTPPLAGWELAAVRYSERRPTSTEVYVAAHGRPPAGLPRGDSDAWFDAVKQALLDQTGGTLARERSLREGKAQGREFVLALPDNATNKVVRVYRAGGLAFYLSAEGAFIPADAPDFRHFFSTFELGAK